MEQCQEEDEDEDEEEEENTTINKEHKTFKACVGDATSLDIPRGTVLLTYGPKMNRCVTKCTNHGNRLIRTSRTVKKKLCHNLSFIVQ